MIGYIQIHAITRCVIKGLHCISKSTNNEVCYTAVLFVWFDSLQHSQQFLSHVGTGFPQTSWV